RGKVVQDGELTHPLRPLRQHPAAILDPRVGEELPARWQHADPYHRPRRTGSPDQILQRHATDEAGRSEEAVFGGAFYRQCQPWQARFIEGRECSLGRLRHRPEQRPDRAGAYQPQRTQQSRLRYQQVQQLSTGEGGQLAKPVGPAGQSPPPRFHGETTSPWFSNAFSNSVTSSAICSAGTSGYSTISRLHSSSKLSHSGGNSCQTREPTAFSPK